MSQSLFITVLAALTIAAGVAFLVMLQRRRRAARTADEHARQAERAADEATRRARDASRAERNEFSGHPAFSHPGRSGFGDLSDFDADDFLAEPPPAKHRTIDDYAIPVGFDARSGSDEETDFGKICPACGARYASHHRYCEHCGDSELAALN